MECLLLVKIASRGDLLLCGPAFRRLREEKPTARITLLVGRSCEDVGRRLSGIDDLRLIDDRRLFSRSRTDRVRGAVGMFREMRGWRRECKKAGCERPEVVLLHRDWRYALLTRFTGIARRRGFASERGGIFLTDPYRAGEREHHIDQYLGVAGLVGGGPVRRGGEVNAVNAVNTVDGVDGVDGVDAVDAVDAVDPVDAARHTVSIEGAWAFLNGEREVALERAHALGLALDRPTIALGFGGGKNVKTRTDLKCWPTEGYQQLAERLSGEGWQVVWLGDGEDRAALSGARSGLDLSGRLSVVETAAVVGHSQAVVANDTLILHLGEALGIPTVGIFGPTDPAHSAPRARHSQTLWRGEGLACAPCHRDGFFPVCEFGHRCMQDLSVDEVHAALGRLDG